MRSNKLVFEQYVQVFHVPSTPVTTACPPSCPIVPTSRLTLVTSDENRRSLYTMSFTVSFNVAISPSTSASIVLDKLWMGGVSSCTRALGYES